MRILESTIEFVVFSAFLLETMAGCTVRRSVWPCSKDDSTFSFADESFKFVAKGGSKNTVFSQYSFMKILELIIIGTSGESESQVWEAVKCPYRLVPRRSGVEAGHLPIQQNYGSGQHENATYNEHGVQYVLFTAWILMFHAKYFNLIDSYNKILKDDFRVSPKIVDFTCPADASREMNRWVQDQTHDRIKDLIKPDDIDRDTTVVFMGAVYFKGFWVNRFDSDETKMRPFHVNGGFSRNVSTMTTTAEFNYGELPEIKAKFIELPYLTNPRHGSLSMFVIVPDDVGGIGELIRNVEKMNMWKLHGGEKKEIELTLPKFEIETTTNLNEVAKSLGITNIFGPAANLTGMTSHRGSSISKIIQTSVITVDEAGTEAAGGTVGFRFASRSNAKPILFNVDRPFIGIIADADGYPFFTAVVADPSSKSSR